MVFQNYALYPQMNVFENIGFGLQDAQDAEGRDRASGCVDIAEMLEPGGAARPQAGATLRRAAAARRDGARDRAPATALPHGRAALEPRREAARPHARRDRAAPARARRDDALRDARPGRGDDDGRADRGDATRRAAAVRVTAGALRPPDQSVRRELPRQSVDEPAQGARSSAATAGSPRGSATGSSICPSRWSRVPPPFAATRGARSRSAFGRSMCARRTAGPASDCAARCSSSSRSALSCSPTSRSRPSRC